MLRAAQYPRHLWGGRRPLGPVGVGLVMATALAVLLLVLGVATNRAGPRPDSRNPTPTSIAIRGVDLHDGMIRKVGRTYYMYGTEYSCGFEWGQRNTPFCGFGVSHARVLAGPWSSPRLLFSPHTVIEATGWAGDNGKTWNAICGATGRGCFNARMLDRHGKWILWFNAVGDYTAFKVDAYWNMSCSGPTGPCSSPHKPTLSACKMAGDFSILVSGSSSAILCSPSTSTGVIHEQSLNTNWTDGVGHGSSTGIEGEGQGAFQLPDGAWEMVYSDPGCGYCSGPPALKSVAGATEVHAGYATAPTMRGPWTAHGVLSPAYCRGQPRTVFTLGGAAYEWLDAWNGSRNETTAYILLEDMASKGWSCG